MTELTIAPSQIHETLKQWILVDGFHLVVDLQASHGSWLVDAVSGRRLLDCYAYFASLPVGHNHERLTGDPDFLRKLERAAIANPANSDIYSLELAESVETFARLARPDEFTHLFFVAGGALAVENALKAAFDWKWRLNLAERNLDCDLEVLHFREAFHGRSGYTLSLTNTDPVKVEGFPKFDWPRVSNPKLRFPVDEVERERVVAAEQLALAEIEHAFESRPHRIAAIIIEPIQGEGGDNHFRPQFLAALRRIADEQQALLIFDEVQTGLGGTGKLWSYEHFGVVPDLIAFGKKTQVCGIMSTDRIDAVEDNVFRVSSRINSTWGGNLVDYVRAARILEIIDEENLIDNAARVGARFLDGLGQLQSRHDAVTNVRGRGLMSAFALPDSHVRDTLRSKLWEIGLATLASGDDSVRFRPPLTIAADEIDLALEMLDEGLGAV